MVPRHHRNSYIAGEHHLPIDFGCDAPMTQVMTAGAETSEGRVMSLFGNLLRMNLMRYVRLVRHAARSRCSHGAETFCLDHREDQE